MSAVHFLFSREVRRTEEENLSDSDGIAIAERSECERSAKRFESSSEWTKGKHDCDEAAARCSAVAVGSERDSKSAGRLSRSTYSYIMSPM